MTPLLLSLLAIGFSIITAYKHVILSNKVEFILHNLLALNHAMANILKEEDKNVNEEG